MTGYRAQRVMVQLTSEISRIPGIPGISGKISGIPGIPAGIPGIRAEYSTIILSVWTTVQRSDTATIFNNAPQTRARHGGDLSRAASRGGCRGTPRACTAEAFIVIREEKAGSQAATSSGDR